MQPEPGVERTALYLLNLVIYSLCLECVSYALRNAFNTLCHTFYTLRSASYTLCRGLCGARSAPCIPRRTLYAVYLALFAMQCKPWVPLYVVMLCATRSSSYSPCHACYAMCSILMHSSPCVLRFVFCTVCSASCKKWSAFYTTKWALRRINSTVHYKACEFNSNHALCRV